MKTINFFSKRSAVILVMFLAFFSTARAFNPSAFEKDLIGVWQLKRAVSDGGIKPVNSKMPPLPSTRILAPESIVLMSDESFKEITINEAFETMIRTETLPFDGTEIVRNIQPEGQVRIKATWKSKKLIVEAQTTDGEKMTETFELTEDRKQLRVTLRIEDRGSAGPLILRRIYERLDEKPQSGDENADIGIVVMPF